MSSIVKTRSNAPVRRSTRSSSRREGELMYLTLGAGDHLYRGEAAGAWKGTDSSAVAFFATSYDVAQKYATKGRTVNMYTLRTPIRLINVCNKEIQSQKHVGMDAVAYTNTDGNCRRTSVLSSDSHLATELCRIGSHNGNPIHGFVTIGAKNFHDEVALCHPMKHIAYPPIDMGISAEKKKRIPNNGH